MLKYLNRKRRKTTAWFLFILFYSEMAGSVYAAGRNYSDSLKISTTYYDNSKKNSVVSRDIPSSVTVKLLHKKALVSKPQKTEKSLIVEKKKMGPEKTDIGGPGQPEMSTFKSVGADNMVNLSTGDFSYNIPLLDVDGYPINIFYNGGATMDQEASWVGLGWNINPGTINRNMRGLPDDFDGTDKVIKEQSMKPDVTVGITGAVNLEWVGRPVGATLSGGIFYNSKRGVGLEAGISGEFKAQKYLTKNVGDECTAKLDTTKYIVTTASAGINLNSQTGLTPSISFQKSMFNKDRTNKSGLSTSIDFNSRSGLGDLRLSGEFVQYKYEGTKIDKKAETDLWNSPISFARTSYIPSIRMPVTNFNATFKAKIGLENYGKATSASISGYYTKTSLSKSYTKQTKDAVGFMYYEKAMDNKNALMDFNRINDGSYTLKTPVISIPVYTYDVFSISGEGTGGSFRGYRGNMGYVKDNYTRTNSGKVNVDLDLGTSQTIKVGGTVGGVYSATVVGGWESENILKQTATFKPNDGLVQQGFYFKNPSEKTIIDETYYNNMGRDKLMRPIMGTTSNSVPPFFQPTTTLQSKFQLFNNQREKEGVAEVNLDNSKRIDRDKRTQVISYLTAYEADRVGLDRFIYSYQENIFKPGICPGDRDINYRTPILRYYNGIGDVTYRKKNHISEITVQEGSKRYVYGLPVYQTVQKEVSFSVGSTRTVNAEKGLVSYFPGVDNSSDNNQGKDGMYQSETIPAYAHSFLLTAILSPDYSDLTGDGISDDDLGTAIKFNYTRVNKISSGPNTWYNLKWRMPVDQNSANFNRGLVTDNSDNKALYTYGEKELWYTHSIESKNHVAVFILSNRYDGWGVAGENGIDITHSAEGCQKKLERIDLYSKADFIKYGTNAKPIKSVHFTYTYKLCKNYPMFYGDASKGNGKLSLESIYFTYNNNSHQKNKYRFKYSGEDDNNIVYNPVENDRWGNYKPHIQNPNGISNEDYPYSNQNRTQADGNSATWNLNQILLPSGAKIDVSYEADDYAFVQNKRAAQMTPILGFGSSPSSTPSNYLYSNAPFQPLWDFSKDYQIVFFSAPVPVNSKSDILRLYLQDMKQLLLKLWVKVPKDSYGQGFEPIFVYCNIVDYNVVPNSGGSKFYVQIDKASHNNGSQIMETVNQYLRDQLPSKAFPGYDVGNKSAVGQIVKALYAMVNNVRTGVTGFENNARADGWCKEVKLVSSGARLCNPYFKKIGGGYRVKQVMITDNWKRIMSPNNPQDIASYYGQIYDYTDTEILNGNPQVISSGVATYEPGVGNEENPFREVLQYSRSNPLGPTANSNIELPFAEMFFPSPSVTYSRVTVKSMHNKDNKNLKSGVGTQETRFYTTRDFPTQSDFTDFDPASRHHYKPGAINKIFNFSQKDYLTLTQGFRVVLNDMNGKVKMQASYPENDSKNPINRTTYFYRMNKTGENKYSLDNIVPVVEGPNGVISNKLVGKDIEVMNDFREHFTFTHSGQIPLNLDFFTLGVWPVLLPTVFRAIFRDESLFRSATTLKVVNQFGILDSVENLDKGSLIGTKNLVYDAETGEVLVSRTKNEFNKPIYNFNYPAYWANEGMGPAYKNIDANYSGILFRNGKIEAGLSESQVNNIFESGDELYANDDDYLTGPKDNPACLADGNACTILPKSNEYRIWALDITKDTRNTAKEFIFIDRYGVPYNAISATIRIIRSGRRNMADASVGSISSMASPILLKPDNVTFDKIFIDNTTNVVNTGAIELKEKWKTQDAFYTLDEIQRVVRQAPILSDSVNVIQSAAFATYLYFHGLFGSTRKYELYPNPNHFIAARYDGGKHSQDYKHRSWLLFDFGRVANLSGNSNILSADINLPSHWDSHDIWVDGVYAGSSHNLSSPHYAEPGNPNDFIISRMLSAWPSFSQWNVWKQKFDAAPPSGINYSKFVFGTPPIPGWSNKDYYEDITPVVRGMIMDKYDLAKNYATALMVNINNETIRPVSIARVCFDKNSPYFPGRIIYIKMKYYNCVPENPIIYQGPAAGAPTVPPPGYMFCNTDEKVTNCRSVFTRQFMNPYVQGLLGNWRPMRSFVYNGERRELDPNAPTTNISKDGFIKDFETFWSLDVNNQQITRTNPGSLKWVWNSAITQFNRKGAELENLDPLGTYNTGIYGYNESLPVAVVNNSRLRLSAFDGFEDYFYKDQSCDLYCKPNKRHFDTKISTSQIDETTAHTGKYSFRTNANSTSSIKINISDDNTVNEPDILIKLNKSIANITHVTLQGTGVEGRYTNCTRRFFGGWVCDLNNYLSVPNDMVYIDNSFPHGVNSNHVKVIWNGILQVEESGTYNLSFPYVDDNGDIWMDLGSGGQMIHQQDYGHVSWHNQVSLVAGHPYPISIGYYQTTGAATISLFWTQPCVRIPSAIPRRNLYMPNSQVGPVTIGPVTCTKVDQVKALSNYLIDEFNLIPLKSMVVSVWVKKGLEDCRCAGYDGFTVKLQSRSNQNVATLLPKGPIIEGWQLFEAVFEVPVDSELDFFIDNGINNLPLFIDDLRFHPYNANMKSFVYNPFNLKPSAELDENNYASFYEYDDDGTLIRVKKETVKGIKTIQETRSGLQKNILDF